MSGANYQLTARSESFHAIITETQCSNTAGNTESVENSFQQLMRLFTHSQKQEGALYLIGNGGSAAVASHAVTDFINVARLRAFVLHESALITCMANDFGYDQAFKRIINTVFRKNDILIAISSSGQSQNICQAVKMVKTLGGTAITFSGFKEDNPLKKLGDINFWLDSMDYGLVEIGHLFLLHNLSDRYGQQLNQDETKQAVKGSLLSCSAL